MEVDGDQTKLVFETFLAQLRSLYKLTVVTG
jgi:hypothetical protein